MNVLLRRLPRSWLFALCYVFLFGLCVYICYRSQYAADSAGIQRVGHQPLDRLLIFLGLKQEVQHRPPYQDLHPYVNIVSSTPAPGANRSDAYCVPLPESPRSGVIICPHPVTGDVWVSGSLLKNKLWERELIYEMDGALKRDPNMMLFDIGCNIGEYTMWAAALDRQVVCVEMVKENVQRVQMALALSNLSSQVTIVNNALYSDHRELEINFYKERYGESRLHSSKGYPPDLRDKSRTGIKVKTVCIDDLTPFMSGKPVYIKMDIENSEHFALMCAHSFFKAVDVRIVQMEWHRKVPNESTPILEFMRVHGYAPSYHSTNYIMANLTQEIDVFFLKKSFFNISH